MLFDGQIEQKQKQKQKTQKPHRYFNHILFQNFEKPVKACLILTHSLGPTGLEQIKDLKLDLPGFLNYTMMSS